MDKIELERLFELFDKALTSTDERVVNALRSLLMIAELTDMGDPLDETAAQWPRREVGPLRLMSERLARLEEEVRNLKYDNQYKYDYSNPGYTVGYGAVPPSTGAGIGSITLSGSTAGTYTTMNTATPDLSLDTITLTNIDLDDILKGHK